MNTTNKRILGKEKEALIARYVQEKGMQVLEANFFCKMGEIDLICKDGSYYVFVEVKYRSSLDKGNPEEAVDLRKQKRISKAALYYLYMHKLPETTPVRFDVASILKEEISYIENAFMFWQRT